MSCLIVFERSFWTCDFPFGFFCLPPYSNWFSSETASGFACLQLIIKRLQYGESAKPQRFLVSCFVREFFVFKFDFPSCLYFFAVFFSKTTEWFELTQCAPEMLHHWDSEKRIFWVVVPKWYFFADFSVILTWLGMCGLIFASLRGCFPGRLIVTLQFKSPRFRQSPEW